MDRKQQANSGSRAIRESTDENQGNGSEEAVETDATELSDIVQRALECAIELIDTYECGPEFYENLDAPVLEQWFMHDHPALARKLVATSSTDTFRQHLDSYCRKLAAAGDIADLFLNRTCYARFGSRKYDTERFFPGVVQQVARDELQFDELPWTVALMADRFSRRSHMQSHVVRHENYRIALHSLYRASPVDWPALEDVQSAPAGTTYLLRRDEFPAYLHFCTLEKYALVVKASPGTREDSLIYGPRPSFSTVESESGVIESWLTFSNGRFTIPMLRNEDTLLLFRNFLPVMFILDDGILLIEYEWNTMAFGRLLLENARHVHATQRAGNAFFEPLVNFKKKHPNCIVVSDVRPMSPEPEAAFELDEFACDEHWDEPIPY